MNTIIHELMVHVDTIKTFVEHCIPALLALLTVGFFFLGKGADFFVGSASGISQKSGIPKIVIGLTFLAMGTSLPEFAVSFTSAGSGAAGIAVGNVLGSNIANVWLILGLSAIICTLAVKKTTFWFEIPFMLAITVVFCIFGLDGTLSRKDGVILAILFAVYLGYIGILAKLGKDIGEEIETVEGSIWKLLIIGIIGIFFIVYGSKAVVYSATGIATFFGVSDRIIGLTIVAFGTSLPELVTSIAAARKNEADLAIGNIVGSNIFNILFVAGFTACRVPIPFDADFLRDGVIAIVVAVSLWVCLMIKNRSLGKKAGVSMLLGYAVYITCSILF